MAWYNRNSPKADAAGPVNPALEGFSETKETVSHVIREATVKGLKGALIGAVALPVVAGAAVLAGVSVIPFGLPALLGVSALSTTMQGFIAGQAATMALNGAVAGLGLGAAGGGIFALLGSKEHNEQAKQELAIKADRQAKLASRERQMAAMMAPTPRMPGVDANPNTGLPYAQGQQQAPSVG